MNVLVCGGAGYVGSHTVAELCERGYGVIVADNLSKGHREAVWEGARFFEGDVRDEGFLEKVFTENKIDAVIDFAAFSIVPESVEDPIKYFENNTAGTINLLKKMVKHNALLFIFSSTASVYGRPESAPITESAPLNPMNPYGESKLMVERMMRWCEAAYGLKYVCLRYFNVAGAHISGRIGEDHNPETHLIPLVLKAIEEERRFQLYGTDYDTEDGTCVRDYIHATDLADAHILSLEKLCSGGESSVYNLGNGKGFSNRQVIDAAERLTGRKAMIENRERRPGDPDTLIASSEKIMNELNWRPKYGGLEVIMETAYRWHSAHPGGFHS